MDLTKITLDEFLASHEDDASPAYFLVRDELVKPGSGKNLKPLKSANGYSIVLLDRYAGIVAAVDSEGNEAGYYTENTLVVHEEHRGQELAPALAIWAYHFRTELPASRSLTKDGRAALTKAWKIANRQLKSDWWP